MDSQRIIINNYDLSTTSINTTTEVKGYTVVKAPKGPITPVLISANSSSGPTKQLQEIFGDWSADYPELYEVVQYISGGFDVYVSAPYQSATVPVAYLTNRGVVAGDSTAEYNIELEKFVNGTLSEEDLSVKNITYFDKDNIDVEYDTRYGHTYFASTKDNIGSYYPEYSSNSLVFKTNTSYNNLTAALPSGDNTIKIKIKGIFGKNLTFVISSGSNNNYIINFNNEQVGEVYSDDQYTVPYTSSSTSSEMYIKLTGKDGKIGDDFISSLASEENRKDITTYWLLPLDTSEIKAVLFPKYPSERKTYVEFTEFSSDKGNPSTSASARNSFGFQAYDTGTGAYGNKGTISESEIDLSTGTTDENYSSQNILAVLVRKPFTFSETLSSISVYPPIVLQGGTREFYKYIQCEDTTAKEGITYYQLKDGNYLKVENLVPGTSSVKNYYTKSSDYDLHNLGWEAAMEDDYSDVDIFFDSSRHNYKKGELFDATNNTFFSLASQHKLSGYIFNYTISPDLVKTFGGRLSYGYNYWNICNEAIFTVTGKGKIYSPMTGSRAKMQSAIIRDRWGGVAPMYLNSAGLGGQLSGMTGIDSLRYTYKKDIQMLLDEKNFNPVIKDSTYGVMVVGQKTCKTDAITDYSYIGHVSAFLNFEKEVKNNVMIPQLGKANNPYYRTLRAEQMEALLSKRLQGANRIWAAAQVDTSTADGCNDVAAQKARKFIINAKVKVDIFSEYVEFNFVNVDQDTVL